MPLSAPSERQLSYTRDPLSETEGVRTTTLSPGKPDLGVFIATHQAEFRDAMASALNNRGDVDDALQHAYLRLIREYDRWPAEQTPEERLAFAYRAIHLAAKDVLVQQLGRSDRAPRPREFAVDFSEDAYSVDGEESDNLQLLAQERLSDAASRYPGDDEHLDNALKVAALAALDPVAHYVLTGGQLGRNNKELAEELGQSHQYVRAINSEARALIFSLLACARGRDIREATDIKLFGYLEGEKLSRVERRLVKRHLKHCANCQEIAALAGHMDAAVQRLALPLPLLLGAGGGVGRLLAAKAATIGPSAANGAAASASASGGGFGGFGSAAAGKLALGLATLALAGAGGAVAVRAHRSPVSHQRGAASTPTAVAAAAPAARPIALPAAKPARVEHHHRVQRKRHRRHRHHERAGYTATTAAPLTPAPSPALATAQTAPAPAAPATSSPPRPPSSGSGGEFVLGGGR